MARKYDLISAVYERTAQVISDSPMNWQNFLRSAVCSFRLFLLYTIWDEKDKTLSDEQQETGRPADDSYLECGLPDFLRESVQAMKEAWKKLDAGQEYLRWDCDYCNLQSDINSAQVNQIISEEQAWYLREKYLRMERI